ncbi:MAG TPA: hypothetical protein VEL47_00850 [Myxococcota bacterium]|nr:hypothetical protein [Myxococcota bacterium]
MIKNKLYSVFALILLFALAAPLQAADEHNNLSEKKAARQARKEERKSQKLQDKLVRVAKRGNVDKIQQCLNDGADLTKPNKDKITAGQAAEKIGSTLLDTALESNDHWENVDKEKLKMEINQLRENVLVQSAIRSNVPIQEKDSDS